MNKPANNILVLTYWSFNDALVQTYTLPYLKLISKHLPMKSRIYLFTLEQPHIALTKDDKSIIEKELASYGIRLLPATYHSFGLKAMLSWLFLIPWLCWFCFYYSISTIHCWCTPAGAIGYFISIITRKPLILDSFEPHAEPMVEAGQWKVDSMAFKVLFKLEKLQCHRAATVVACVEKMKDYAKEKYAIALENFYYKPACVDLDLFKPSKAKNQLLLQQLGLENKIVCVYAGKFGGSYLKQEVFDFFKIAYDFWGENFHVVLLTNHSENEMKAWAKNSGFPTSNIRKKFIPHHQIPEYIGLGDFGIVPFVPVPSKRYGSPIKTGEYMAMGLPMVITRNISDDSDMIEAHDIGAVLKQLDQKEYKMAVSKIDTILSEDRLEVHQKIRSMALRYKNFDLANEVYRSIYSLYSRNKKQ